MFKNLFTKTNNRTIYKGDKTSASVVKDMYNLINDNDAKNIDRQELQIKSLERQAKSNATIRFYMYGR